MKNILVTGGAGFVASHSVIELLNAGYEVVAVDNFVNAVQISYETTGRAVSLERVEKITGKSLTFIQADIRDQQKMKDILVTYHIDCVIHYAGLKAVGESVEQPLLYYSNNVVGALALLQAMKEVGVKSIIFSSSATVYGPPQKLPLTEEHPVGQGLTNPYGQTKYFIERILMDLARAEKVDWNVVILRYFNPVGAHESGMIGEDPKGIPNNLMPYVSKVAGGKLPFVRVYGKDYDTPDGTGVRDYIHVMDLATGHTAALDKLNEGNIGCKIYNLGTGRGYSVLEMIAALEKACGHKIPYQVEGRRDGDIATVYCNPEVADKELKWTAKMGLEEMCRDLWNWQKNNPDGFQSC